MSITEPTTPILQCNEEEMREEAFLAGDLERERRKCSKEAQDRRIAEIAALEQSYFNRQGWGF